MCKSKPAIASAAKQSILVCPSITNGSPRRCAPRDDGLMQTCLSKNGFLGAFGWWGCVFHSLRFARQIAG